MSGLEKIVNKILLEAKKEFVREKQFPEIYNGLYKVDFYLPRDKIAIEVQGQQHYEYSKFFHKTISNFKKAQERDRRKLKGLLALGIKPYCIPYWEIENIHSFKDLISEKFHATTQYHNDIVWREHQKSK